MPNIRLPVVRFVIDIWFHEFVVKKIRRKYIRDVSITCTPCLHQFSWWSVAHFTRITVYRKCGTLCKFTYRDNTVGKGRHCYMISLKETVNGWCDSIRRAWTSRLDMGWHSLGVRSFLPDRAHSWDFLMKPERKSRPLDVRWTWEGVGAFGRFLSWNNSANHSGSVGHHSRLAYMRLRSDQPPPPRSWLTTHRRRIC